MIQENLKDTQIQLKIEKAVNAEAIKKIIKLKKDIYVLTTELNGMQTGMKMMMKYYTK
tara:strand:+ start:318 stop:491 length:174 start_codon:yes stop_codon:yes gene_type:complete